MLQGEWEAGVYFAVVDMDLREAARASGVSKDMTVRWHFWEVGRVMTSGNACFRPTMLECACLFPAKLRPLKHLCMRQSVPEARP